MSHDYVLYVQLLIVHHIFHEVRGNDLPALIIFCEGKEKQLIDDQTSSTKIKLFRYVSPSICLGGKLLASKKSLRFFHHLFCAVEISSGCRFM